MTDTMGQQLLDALDEIDQLTGAKAALQEEIERLRALNDDLQEESQHRQEMLERQKAEIERLLGVCKDRAVLLKDAYTEIDRLKAERHTTKMMLHDILDKHIPKKPVG